MLGIKSGGWSSPNLHKEWFTMESHKIVKPLTFPLVHNVFKKLIVLNMKTMKTTTTNMIFYMVCINIINPIDIHMRRETKSQNIWSVFQRVHFKRGHSYQGKHEPESWTWVEQGYYVNSYCILMLIIIVN
jgi:hypothetical protein